MKKYIAAIIAVAVLSVVITAAAFSAGSPSLTQAFKKVAYVKSGYNCPLDYGVPGEAEIPMVGGRLYCVQVYHDVGDGRYGVSGPDFCVQVDFTVVADTGSFSYRNPVEGFTLDGVPISTVCDGAVGNTNGQGFVLFGQ